MLTHKLATVLVTLAIAVSTNAWCQEAVLSTDRVSYLLHEPVELRIDYINRTDKPWIKELPPEWLSVSQPNGQRRRVGLWQDRGSEVSDEALRCAVIKPGETYRRTVWVALDRAEQWIFPSAGRWHIGVDSSSAARIEIEIAQPAADDVKEAAALFGAKACKALLSDGHEMEESATILQKIIDKYPRTTFASFAAWALVQNQWTHSSTEIDWAKEQAWLSTILQGPKDHSLRPAAMYAIVRYHQFQRGHKDQAKKAADDLARAYPWSTWARAMRPEFGHDVSAKLAPFSNDPALKCRREVHQPPSGTPLGEKPAAAPADGKVSSYTIPVDAIRRGPSQSAKGGG